MINTQFTPAWHLILAGLALACAMLFSGTVQATTYYIDFASGDNSADGTSPKTAWKHSPGDANATGKPKAHALSPGDTVLFKGGVTYRGSLVINTSGSKGKPIRYDGNLQGTYGKGPAVLDGGKIITGWQRCTSADDAKGNTRWKDIFYADVDVDISKNFNHGEVVSHRKVPKDKMAPWQRLILVDGERSLLPIAQLPKPKDNFYPDLPGGFWKSPVKLEVDKAKNTSTLTDPTNLTETADYYTGMQIGVHGGNNHVYFATVTGFSPEKKQLTFPAFKPKRYPKTGYALFNSVRLITEKGEWAVQPIENGKTRFYYYPKHLTDGKPTNIGYPVLETGIHIMDGASHLEVTGFLIQRFSGGKGAVAIKRATGKRSSHIDISNLEIRFLTGSAGIAPHYADHLIMNNLYIHSCPGWTTAIFLNRIKHYEIKNCLLVKNSGSGIRHYESKHGHIHGNTILDHYGMHSSTLNMYEGCEDILVENNYMNNIITINRNAKKLTLRNNVVDSQHKSGINIALWGSGSVGGRNMSNIVIENNTLINLSPKNSWGSSVFVQGKAPAPTGLVIRNNVLDLLRGNVTATIENNIFMRKTDDKLMGNNAKVVSDAGVIFQNSDKEDYRRKGDILSKSGADLPSPRTTWQRMK